MFRFHPRPTMFPLHMTTAPTGTSPASRARCAERKASCIQTSSEAVVGGWASAVGNSSLGFWGSKRSLGDILAVEDEFAAPSRTHGRARQPRNPESDFLHEA